MNSKNKNRYEQTPGNGFRSRNNFEGNAKHNFFFPRLGFPSKRKLTSPKDNSADLEPIHDLPPSRKCYVFGCKTSSRANRNCITLRAPTRFSLKNLHFWDGYLEIVDRFLRALPNDYTHNVITDDFFVNSFERKRRLGYNPQRVSNRKKPPREL